MRHAYTVPRPPSPITCDEALIAIQYERRTAMRVELHLGYAGPCEHLEISEWVGDGFDPRSFWAQNVEGHAGCAAARRTSASP